MAAKKPKKRADKYEEKIKVKGSFNELMGALFPKTSSPKKKAISKKDNKK